MNKVEIEVRIKDNSKEILAALEERVLKAATICGMTVEGYAKKLTTVDTGLLRNSITYAVSGEKAAIEKYEADRPKPGRKNSGEYSGTAPEASNGTAVYIGTNVAYSGCVECGTSKMAAKPFLKPAVADHANTYRNIIKRTLKGEL